MITKTLFLSVTLAILSLPALAEDTPITASNNILSILEECSEVESHGDMEDCLDKKVIDSEIALKEAENSVTKHISDKNGVPADIARMKKTYENGRRAFKSYRDKECELYAALAAGGNGAGDMHQACVVELNSERIEQLKHICENW